MVESLSDLDTSRAPDKPDLRPLPEDPPGSPTNHGVTCGLRDWYWSEIRRELDVLTGGAANYNERTYELGYEVLEVLETLARDRGLRFPSEEAKEWFSAGLNASSFTIGEDKQIRFQGPKGLPEFFLEKALAFAVRRADRALDLYGEQSDSVDRHPPPKGERPPEPEPEPEPDKEEPSEPEQSPEPEDPPEPKDPGGPGPKPESDQDQEADRPESTPNPPPEQGSLF